MSAAPRVTVHMRSVRLWPLPLYVMWLRVGTASRRWHLVTPWGLI